MNRSSNSELHSTNFQMRQWLEQLIARSWPSKIPIAHNTKKRPGLLYNRGIDNYRTDDFRIFWRGKQQKGDGCFLLHDFNWRMSQWYWNCSGDEGWLVLLRRGPLHSRLAFVFLLLLLFLVFLILVLLQLADPKQTTIDIDQSITKRKKWEKKLQHSYFSHYARAVLRIQTILIVDPGWLSTFILARLRIPTLWRIPYRYISGFFVLSTYFCTVWGCIFKKFQVFNLKNPKFSQ